MSNINANKEILAEVVSFDIDNSLSEGKTTIVDLRPEHAKPVMEIFNYYILKSFAAFPEKELPLSYFNEFLKITTGYPAKAVVYNNRVIGFGFLRPYKPFSTFSLTAEIAYFFVPEFKGKGLGKQLLTILEGEGLKMKIKAIFASIVSLNQESLIFHQRNGFVQVGALTDIGYKFGKAFDIIWMKKIISPPNRSYGSV